MLIVLQSQGLCSVIFFFFLIVLYFKYTLKGWNRVRQSSPRAINNLRGPSVEAHSSCSGICLYCILIVHFLKLAYIAVLSGYTTQVFWYCFHVIYSVLWMPSTHLEKNLCTPSTRYSPLVHIIQQGLFLFKSITSEYQSSGVLMVPDASNNIWWSYWLNVL